jgi:hypothetical protein
METLQGRVRRGSSRLFCVNDSVKARPLKYRRILLGEGVLGARITPLSSFRRLGEEGPARLGDSGSESGSCAWRAAICRLSSDFLSFSVRSLAAKDSIIWRGPTRDASRRRTRKVTSLPRDQLSLSTRHQSQQAFFLLVPVHIDASFERPSPPLAGYMCLPSPQLSNFTGYLFSPPSSPHYSLCSFDPDSMPATEQSSRTYTCGLSLSLHADFVFRAYRKTPTELVARRTRTTALRNALTRRVYDLSERTRRHPDPLLGRQHRPPARPRAARARRPRLPLPEL